MLEHKLYSKYLLAVIFKGTVLVVHHMIWEKKGLVDQFKGPFGSYSEASKAQK